MEWLIASLVALFLLCVVFPEVLGGVLILFEGVLEAFIENVDFSDWGDD